MTAFRQKPIEVDAIIWDDAFPLLRAPKWLIDAMSIRVVSVNNSIDCLTIKSTHRIEDTVVFPGDYIVRKSNGEIVRYDPVTFASLYAEVL